MKHLSLKIEKPGYIINIPGLSTMRSPCSLDISNLNIQQVLNSLSSMGIVDFKIISSSVSSKVKNLEIKKDESKPEPEPEPEILLEEKTSPIQVNCIDYSFELNDINSKLKFIIETIKTQPTMNYKASSDDILDKDGIEEEQIFIPNTNIEGMKISQQNIESSKMNNLDSSVNALKSIKKSKKK